MRELNDVATSLELGQHRVMVDVRPRQVGVTRTISARGIFSMLRFCEWLQLAIERDGIWRGPIEGGLHNGGGFSEADEGGAHRGAEVMPPMLSSGIAAEHMRHDLVEAMARLLCRKGFGASIG